MMNCSYVKKIIFTILVLVPVSRSWALDYNGPTCGLLNEEQVKLSLSSSNDILRRPIIFLTIDDLNKQSVLSAYLLLDISAQNKALQSTNGPVQGLGYQFTMTVYDKTKKTTEVYDSVCAAEEISKMDMSQITQFTFGLVEIKIHSAREHGIDIEMRLPREMRVGVMSLAKRQIAKSHFLARASFAINPYIPTEMRTIVQIGDVVGDYEHLAIQFGPERDSFLTVNYPTKIAAVGLRKMLADELVDTHDLHTSAAELPVTDANFDAIVMP